MRILVVEDERPIAEFVQRGLEAEGYSVACAYDGEEGLAMALTGDYALVLLDVLLPKLSGLEVMKAIRERDESLPVIMLTALAETDDVVTGLDLGASDYLTKPFAFAELLARIRAHLRQPGQANATELAVGGISLDFRTREVSRDGRGVKLTAREFELLAYLMRHPGPGALAGTDPERRLGLRLRPGHERSRRLHRLPAQEAHRGDGDAPIQTVRSAGYRLVSADA